MTGMANHWVQKGRQVTLFTQDSGESEDAYFVEPDVERVYLNMESASTGVLTAVESNFHRLSELRSGFKTHKPDIVIAFLPQVNILSVIAARLERIPVIIAERSNPKHDPLPRAWKILRSVVYPFSNRLVVQTDRARAMYSSQIRKKCVVIPNFVREMKSNTVKLNNKARNIIIAVGRLCSLKRFDMLIESFSGIMDKFPSWDLEIWGRGSEEKTLRELIVSKKAEERIRLMGSSSNIEDRLNASDIFVLTSRYEGFPNALCEAMACGLTVISTDCNSGPREIIDHEVNGLLIPVDDVQSLSNAIARLISDVPLRVKMGEKAKEVIKEKYSIDTIMQYWDQLILECL